MSLWFNCPKCNHKQLPIPFGSDLNQKFECKKCGKVLTLIEIKELNWPGYSKFLEDKEE